jgi:hypothetical protein
MFGRGLRTDEGRREDNERVFAFLDRSARPSSAKVRGLLTDWLSKVPEGSDRNALQGILATRKNDESFESGFWELYLHEAYRRSGYTITIHPDVPGASTHPDFLIEGHGSRFYLEAVRAGTSPALRGQAQRLADVRTKLRAQRAQQFILSVTCHSIGPGALKTSELIGFLDRWLAGLGQETAAWTYAANLGHQRLPRTRWPKTPARNGWSFEFEAIPIPPDRQGTHLPLAGAFIGGVTPTGLIRSLRSALETKAAKYGRDIPLVIALLSNTGLGTGDDDVGLALFGTQRHAAAPSQPAGHGSEPGFWRDSTGWRHDHVIQVVAAQDLYPWSITLQQPRLWSNPRPRADLPVPAQPGWLCHVQADRHDPAVAVLLPAADPPAQFFGLPHSWPD